MLELDCAKVGWWKAVELRMSGIVGGKKDIGLFGSTGSLRFFFIYHFLIFPVYINSDNIILYTFLL